MPTVFRSGPYRVYFFSNEGSEPLHVHVDRDENTAKLWLQPLELARSSGFDGRELSRILALLAEREAEILEAWNEHFRVERRPEG